jgi:hypothetical protein
MIGPNKYRGVALLMVFGLAGDPISPAQARQPKPTLDDKHCSCICDFGPGVAPVEYSNPGSCGVLNGKTCNVEVNQQGTSVVRTGHLDNCGVRVILPWRTIPDLRPTRASPGR